MSGPLPGIVVNIALIDADGRVLLTKREDFEVWCLPAGEIEWGESLAEAAIREFRGAVGLEIELERLVGLYSRPWLRGYHTAVVFAGRPVGGMLYTDPDEVIDVDYFGIDDLPDDLLWGQRERIVDALKGVGGSEARTTQATRPDDLPWNAQELHELRDASGLTRAAYYKTVAEQFGDEQNESELVGEKPEQP